MNDPNLLSTIDIDKLLESLENDKNDYLENKTMKIVTDEIYETIQQIPIPQKIRFDYCKKLVGYRLVDDVHELHKGKHIRWIIPKKRPIILERGAILSDIKFTDMGTNLQCLRYDQRTYQIRMDDRIIFQKMSTEELLLLTIYENIKNGKIGHGASKASPQARTEGPSVQRHHP
jgi:hypothetical protein